jgi:hypothetical protein
MILIVLGIEYILGDMEQRKIFAPDGNGILGFELAALHYTD